jgi:hypothetical protein
VAISPFFGVGSPAEADLALAYKAKVPVLTPLQLVLTELESPLILSEQLLFCALVTLDLTPHVNETCTT